jgi:SAM-dependent methyltransferase
VAEDLGQLAAGTWGVAVLTACAELGMVEALQEPASAAALAAGAGVSPALAERLLDVLVALGLAERDGDGYRGTPELFERPPAYLAADGASGLLQAADLVRRAASGTLGGDAWSHTEPLVLQAQGTMSAGAVPMLARFVFPSASGIPERLEAGAAFLDVGAGVGAISIALCRLYPALRAVGLEPMQAARALAVANVAEAGLSDRIELRAELVQELEEVEEFDIVWLPLSFLPRVIVPAALERLQRAMRPGGLLLTATHGGTGDDLAGAAARLRAVLWGGDAPAPDEVSELLAAAGFDDVALGQIPGSTLVPMRARRP